MYLARTALIGDTFQIELEFSQYSIFSQYTISIIRTYRITFLTRLHYTEAKFAIFC